MADEDLKKEKSVSQNLISQRALTVIDYPNPLLNWNIVAAQDCYDSQNNPKGIINFGIAENRLCEELLVRKISEILPTQDDVQTHYYFTSHGTAGFRKALRDFITDFFDPREAIDAENIIVSTGVTAVLEMLSFAIAEPGDYFLSPAPYYARIRNDLFDKGRVLCYDVPIQEKTSSGRTILHLTQNKLEKAYVKAVKEGCRVRGLILINPNNPTGHVFTRQELLDCLQFAERHQLHVISDEIYALTTFDEDTKFTSVLSLPCRDTNRIHFIWGFSKDFSFSGYRCGILHTTNPLILQFGKKVVFYATVPALVQNILEKFLLQKEWLREVYLPTMLQRMREAYKTAEEMLKRHGVTVFPAKGGLFIWANFSKFLKNNTFEGETELFHNFFKHRVFCAFGRTFYSEEPGWFRIIFTNKMHVLKEGLQRIQCVLNAASPTSHHLYLNTQALTNGMKATELSEEKSTKCLDRFSHEHRRNE